MIRIALVEDEAIYVNQMQEYLERYSRESGHKISLKVYGDGEDILEYYTGEYDVILLDIQMRFMDGMTAAERIRELDRKVILIFVTNMVQYAVRGYSVDAMDYILKPVDYFMFSQRLDKAVEKLREKEDHYISLRTKAGIRKVALGGGYRADAVVSVSLLQGKICDYRCRLRQSLFAGGIRRLSGVAAPLLYTDASGFSPPADPMGYGGADLQRHFFRRLPSGKSHSQRGGRRTGVLK